MDPQPYPDGLEPEDRIEYGPEEIMASQGVEVELDGVPGYEETEEGAGPPPLDRRSTLLSLAALAGLLLFHGLCLGMWISKDAAPPAWDQSIQMETALDCRDAIQAGEWSSLLSFSPKPGMPPFPILYHLTLQPFMGGEDPAKAALWANWFYLLLLCVSIWGLGRHFLGNWAGFGAAAVFSCVPEVQWLLRENLTDLALTAWTAAAYWALVESRDFRRKWISAAFGALFAAAMMTKWSAFSYFFPVLWLGYHALRDSSRKKGVLLAAGTALLLCFPWYFSQWPVLIPRLFSAAGDQAVAIWNPKALFSYVLQAASGLELPFFLLAVAAVTAPSLKRRPRPWVLIAWLATSFVFWTIVPNRQLRYLLPGLTPLAIFVMGSFPKQLSVGLVVFYLFAALNFGAGMLGPLPLGPITLLRTGPPESAPWPLRAILQEAAARRRSSLPISNLTLLANHPRLNGPTLRWERRRGGFETLRTRGVNSRVCELSEFLVLKEGSLGPASVVNQLPAVRKRILRVGSWFLRGYDEVKRFPLPDGRDAVLFQRKKLRRAPFPEQRAHFTYFEEKNFLAEGLLIQFGRWDAARGEYPKVVVSAKRIVFRGLEVAAPRLVLEGLSFVPVDDSVKEAYGAEDTLLDIRLLGMRRLRLVSGSVTEDAAAAFLKARAKEITQARFKLDDSISAWVKAKGIPAFAEVSVRLREDKGGLDMRAERVAVAGIPLPLGLLGRHAGYALPFSPTGELPFHLDIAGLTVAGGRLRIGK